MNRFQVMSGAVIIYCLAMVAVACYISNAAWYEWLIAIAVNVGYDIAAISQKVKVDPKASSNMLRVYASAAKGVPVTEPSIREWKKWCTLVIFVCTGALGLTCVLLDTLSGIFGGIVVTSICVSVIYMCRCREDLKQYHWYHGWVCTMWVIIGIVICQLVGNFGFSIVMVIAALCMGLLTLGAGFKYYVWPLLKKFAESIKETYQMLQEPESEAD